jgi:enoyl-CoA hydratase
MSLIKNLFQKIDEGILIISIDRPDKLNALNQATLSELREVIQENYDNDEVNGIIITGSGDKAFAAGADIKEFTELSEVNGRKFAENGQEVMTLIEDCPKPVIAVVNGYALGGGCELALACHMRIATQSARFGMPEVTLGLIPAYGGTQRLSRLIGKGRAYEMMMTGEMINAEKAMDYGLINYLVEDKNKGLEKATALLQKIAQNAPLALSMLINCVNTAFVHDEDGFLMEANSFANCCKSKDFKEGTQAFLEKRKPKFTGD